MVGVSGVCIVTGGLCPDLYWEFIDGVSQKMSIKRVEAKDVNFRGLHSIDLKATQRGASCVAWNMGIWANWAA